MIAFVRRLSATCCSRRWSPRHSADPSTASSTLSRRSMPLRVALGCTRPTHSRASDGSETRLRWSWHLVRVRVRIRVGVRVRVRVRVGVRVSARVSEVEHAPPLLEACHVEGIVQ